MMLIARGRFPQTPTEWAVVGGIVVCGIAWRVISVDRDRKRRERVMHALRAAGMRVTVNEADHAADNALICDAVVPGAEAVMINWGATGTRGGRFIRAAEYRCLVRRSRTDLQRVMVVAATDVSQATVPPPVMDNWHCVCATGPQGGVLVLGAKQRLDSNTILPFIDAVADLAAAAEAGPRRQKQASPPSGGLA